MNNVIDEVLAGEPRYTIKDNGGTTLYDNVQIDLKTQVTTAGTPINKALFDSIATDINSRLLISSKATEAEAMAGRTNNISRMNDTNYMTPQKVQKALNSLTNFKSHSSSGTSTTTVVDFNTIYNANVVTVTGKVSGSGGRYEINGSGIGGFTSQGTVSGGASLNLSHASSSSTQSFMFVFDLNSESFIGHYVTDVNNTPRTETICGRFTTLTTFRIYLTSGKSFDATIQLNS